MSSLLERLYLSAPPWLQNLGVTWYGWKVYRREYGRKFERLLAEFESHDRWSREDLQRYQDEQLATLIAHVYEHVPYYRRIMQERRLQPQDIRSVEDLPRLPVLTPDDIRTHFDELIADNVVRSRLHHGHTSGTTGSPLQFLYDDRVCLVKNVVDWRQKRWAGINPGDRMAFFLGRVVVPVSRSRPPFWRYNRVLKHLFFSSFHLSPDTLDIYFDKLGDFQPLAIEGYPSTMFILARYLLSRNQTFPVRAVFTSSETLFPQQREAIEQAFACKLFDFYGMAERVVFATECEQHCGHHLNSDFGVTEIVCGDDSAGTPGEMGRIVATGLHNYAMPLIRYRTSDITAVSRDRCACGRPYPLMAEVTTKDEDIVTTPDGRFVSSSILTHPFKPLASVRESQIIQEDRNHLVVKVVPRESFSDRDRRYLIDELTHRLGPEMRIEVVLVDRIPRTAAGKFRWVISKVPLEL